MAYDEALAQRIRDVLGDRADVTEKAMFGGIAFLRDGKMFIGIVKDDLMVRVGPDLHAASLEKTHVRPMDFAGRPMRGYVYVGPEATATTSAIEPWVDASYDFVATVTASKKKSPAKKSPAKKRA